MNEHLNDLHHTDCYKTFAAHFLLTLTTLSLIDQHDFCLNHTGSSYKSLGKSRIIKTIV